MKAAVDKGSAARTINSRCTNICTLWGYAYRKSHVEKLWRDIPRMRVPKRIPEAWTLDELQALLTATDTFQHPLRNGVREGAFWRAFILVVYDTGIRFGDVMALRGNDLRDGCLVVMVHKTDVEILRPLSPEAIKAIEVICSSKREFVFDWPYAKETFSVHWRKLVKAAGLPTGPKQGPHKLRRTSASHLEAVAPGTAGRHLGHLTPGLAEASYIDPRIAKPQNAAALLPRPVLREGGAA